LVRFEEFMLIDISYMAELTMPGTDASFTTTTTLTWIGQCRVAPVHNKEQLPVLHVGHGTSDEC